MGATAATGVCFLRPLLEVLTGGGCGVAAACCVSATICVVPTSPVVTLRGSVRPLGSRTMVRCCWSLFCRRFCVDGLMATVFWGAAVAIVTTGWAGAGVAAGSETGVVMMAWLVPGMSWIWLPCGTIWMVCAPWIWGTIWYWMLAGAAAAAGRVGLWMVSRMGLAPEAPRPAGSWITLPLADRKPRAFLGGAGAMGAGLMGCRRRVVGWAGGVLTGAWAAGGPILLQVAARRARGEGWES